MLRSNRLTRLSSGTESLVTGRLILETRCHSSTIRNMFIRESTDES